MNNSINSVNPVNLINLRFFSDPSILKGIGSIRLAMFLNGFSNELKAFNVPLPDPESANGSYFDSLAVLLSSPAILPERLSAALFTLEKAASPENHACLESIIQRRIPCVSLTGCSAADRALEIWFTDPKELLPFAPPAVVPPFAPKSEEGGSSIQNQNSKIENTDDPPAAPPASVPTDWVMHVKPWPEPVDAKLLLDTLRLTLRRFLVLPKWVAETLALWILHTYAFEWRDVSTYLGVESPERRCGKTTLLTILCRLVNRPVVSANVSSPAFFRAIEELKPTLMIDEADRFLKSKNDLQGILNAGYHRPTAYVLRMVNQSKRVSPSLPPREERGGERRPSARSSGSRVHGEVSPDAVQSGSALAFFSCWCPKVISQIGRLPETLADRCIVFRMQRKTPNEECERIRNLETITLRRQCARFVLDHGKQISNARPELPKSLNDRAADIWEPLFVLADLAGGEWPELARQAAVSLSASAEDTNSIGSLLLDIFVLFAVEETDRMFTRTLLDGLNQRTDRPWAEMRNGKEITDLWLSQQLRPYGIRPRTVRIGDSRAKGYFQEDFMETFRRYIPRSELDALLADRKEAQPPTDDSQKVRKPAKPPEAEGQS